MQTHYLFLFAGGAIGGLVAYIQVKTFKPLAIVIKELPAHEKEKLAESFKKLISSIDYTNTITLMSLVQSQPLIQSQVIEFLKLFFVEVRQIKPITGSSSEV